MLRMKCSAKSESTNTTSAPQSASTSLQLLAREAQVERGDDAGAEEGGVVQLEVLVAVARHDRESTRPASRPSSLPHAVHEAQDAVGVLGVAGVVVAVVEPDPRRVPVDRREERPMEHELLHGETSCGAAERGLRSCRHAERPTGAARRSEAKVPHATERWTPWPGARQHVGAEQGRARWTRGTRRGCARGSNRARRRSTGSASARRSSISASPSCPGRTTPRTRCWPATSPCGCSS